MMARRRISSGELATKIGLSQANLSILKTGKARAIRFSTLDSICQALECQPGEILEYRTTEIEYKDLNMRNADLADERTTQSHLKEGQVGGKQ